MSNWYIDLNGSVATGVNSIANPYSSSQFFDLLQGLPVDSNTASSGDIFFLKGYYYNPSLVTDSLINAIVKPWDLLKYGPWVIDSPLEFNMSLVDFSGGVINLNTPDSCELNILRDIMLISQSSSGNLTLTGSLSEGSTIITKGSTGDIFNTSSHTLTNCTIINEDPLSSSVSTTINLENCLINLVDGAGAGEFFGGTNIIKGSSVYTQYGWTAPIFSRLPYTGNLPSVRDVSTLMNEKILITPQSVSSSVPNYTTDLITVELSSGSHTDYEQGLQGELREVDDGATNNRKYKSSGVGAWWFSQEDLEINDSRSSTEEAIFNANNGGSFLKNSSDQNSLFIRDADIYKNTSTFPDINSYIITPDSGNSYFSKFNFSVWVRKTDIGVKLWELTDSTGSTTYSKLEVTGSNEITISSSNVVTLPYSINSSTWHLLTVTVDKTIYTPAPEEDDDEPIYNYYVKTYLDKSLVTSGQFYFELTGIGSSYRIYMPRINSIGKSVEVSRPRFSISKNVLKDQVIFSIHDLELGKLP